MLATAQMKYKLVLVYLIALVSAQYLESDPHGISKKAFASFRTRSSNGKEDLRNLANPVFRPVSGENGFKIHCKKF